jgi:hypothetical protein
MEGRELEGRREIGKEGNREGGKEEEGGREFNPYKGEV